VTVLCADFESTGLNRITSWNKHYSTSIIDALIILSELFRQLFLIYGDIVPIMISLTLWTPCLQFSKLVKKNAEKVSDYKPEGEYSNLKIYKELKKLSTLVNLAFDAVVFSYTLDALTYNSTHLMDAVTGPWKEQVMMLYSIVHVSSVFYSAADSCRQVSLKKNR